MENVIALAGNPNSGKTTLFNELTGARQHVGNYPGVTVEKKQGVYINNGEKLQIVDLPGTYSLSAYSLEEVVARNFLTDEKPAVIVNIVDASNLERNLYLTLQFLEMGIPVCIALNMMDVARKRGIEIDAQKLSLLMGTPVVTTIARTGKGKEELMEAAVKASENKSIQGMPDISFGKDIDDALFEMIKVVEKDQLLTEKYKARWVALKFLENDGEILKECWQADRDTAEKLQIIAGRTEKHLKSTLDALPEDIIADHRYGYIKSVLLKGVLKHRYDKNRLHTSDKIDRVVTNRFLGPIIAFFVVAGLYHFTFTYSELPVALFESFFAWLGVSVDSILSDGLLKSMLISGVIDGVGGVLGFVPIIAFMFFGISVLEDSGYLARLAFMLDRIFRIFGLHGSSVMPFIISGGIAGGCAVPGVMAARTLKSRRERLATLLTVPFMNCGAKLPVFVLLVSAFFAEHEAAMMLLITGIAWVGALLAAKFLRMTVIRGESTPFIMELPPYRLPTLKGLLIHTWERTWGYIKKAGTVILGISIILWALMTFPGLPESEITDFQSQKAAILAEVSTDVAAFAETDSEELLTDEVLKVKSQLDAVEFEQAQDALRYSIAGRIGRSLEGITGLAGFDWRTNIALLGGFAAKEVVVSTLGTAYSLGEVDPEDTGSLSETLSIAPGWSPLTAFALIVFTIFYAPCFVTVVCIAKEAGSWKWAGFSVVFNTMIAFGLSVIVFQAGKALGF